jgi:hypothetical protein
VYHFLRVDGNASNSLLAVSFDLVFDYELVGPFILAGIEIECFHRLQINYLLIFPYLNFLSLKGVGGWFEFLAGLKQSDPEVAFGEDVALEDQS